MKRTHAIRTAAVAAVAVSGFALASCAGGGASGEVTLDFIQSGDINQGGGYANKDLWDEAGVSYPSTLDESWTWDEY